MEKIGSMNRGKLLLYSLVWCLMMLNSQVGMFSDDMDNWLGGVHITEGKVLYSEYASHHMPLPYYVGAGLSLIFRDGIIRDVWETLGLGSHDDYGLQRLGLANLQFIALLGLHAYLRRTIFDKYMPWIALVIALISVGFFAQMLLAQTMVAYATLAAILIVLGRILPGKYGRSDLYVIGFLSFVIVFSAAMYAFLAAILFGGCWLFMTRGYWKRDWHLDLILAPALVAMIPLLYFLISDNFGDFWWQNFEFNNEYYADYLTISDNAWSRPIEIVVHFASRTTHTLAHPLNADYSAEVGWLIFNIAIIALLVERRRFVGALVVFGFLLLGSDVRVTETVLNDLLVVNMVSVFISIGAGAYAIHVLVTNPPRYAFFRNTIIVMLILGGIYGTSWSANHTFLAYKMLADPAETLTDDSQPWFTWRATDIRSDNMPYAQFINDMLDESDTTWLGPIMPEEALFLEPQLASRYAIYLPWHADAPRTTRELLAELKANRPPIIVFYLDAIIRTHRMRDHAYELSRFLNDNYALATGPLPHVYFLRNTYDELDARMRMTGHGISETDRDVVFYPADPKRWIPTPTMEPIVGDDGMVERWLIQDDPNLTYALPLRLCLADYTHIYMRMAASPSIEERNTRSQIFFRLVDDPGFNEEHSLVLSALDLTRPDPFEQFVNLTAAQFDTETYVLGLRFDPVRSNSREGDWVAIEELRFIHNGTAESACQ